jgi:hypothetical protein
VVGNACVVVPSCTLNTLWLIADTLRRADLISIRFSNIQVAACLGLVFGGMRGSVVSRCSNEPLGRVAADGRWKMESLDVEKLV